MRMIAGDGPPKNNVMNDQFLRFPAQQTTLTIASPDERSDCVPSLAASADLATGPVWVERTTAPVHGIARSSTRFQASHCRRAEGWPWGIQFRIFPAMLIIALLIAEKAARMGRFARIALATVWASDDDLSSAFAHDGTASLATGKRFVRAFGVELAEVPSEDGTFFATPFTGIGDRCSHSTSPAMSIPGLAFGGARPGVRAGRVINPPFAPSIIISWSARK